MSARRFPFPIIFSGLLAIPALFCVQCRQPDVVVPPPPDPEEIEPFDPAKLRLFYELTIDQAESFLKNNGDIIVIDIRAPEHFAAAHIAGARNIPAPSDAYESTVRTLDPGAKILIYGYSSDFMIDEFNAMDAVNVLRKADYRNLYWMTQGYPAWIQSKKPVVDAQGKPVADPPLGPMPEPKPEEAGKAPPAPK
jgi:rhodanese-related sulfurtransferase